MFLEFMFNGDFKLHYSFSIKTFKKAQEIECDVTLASNKGSRSRPHTPKDEILRIYFSLP